MYLADYHLHTTCSPDGRLTASQIAEIALARGLHEICITDHLDTIFWNTYAPRTDFDWPALQCQIDEARALYGDRLVIRMGAELGEATISFERADILLQNAPPLDFVIGSVHTASKRFDYFDLYYLEKREMDYYRAIMEDYLDETVKLVQYGKFHVLGHLTLPLRYIKNNVGLDLTFDDRLDRLEEINDLLSDPNSVLTESEKQNLEAEKADLEAEKEALNQADEDYQDAQTEAYKAAQEAVQAQDKAKQEQREAEQINQEHIPIYSGGDLTVNARDDVGADEDPMEVTAGGETKWRPVYDTIYLYQYYAAETHPLTPPPSIVPEE